MSVFLKEDRYFYAWKQENKDRKNKKYQNAAHKKAASVCLQIKRSCKTKAEERGEREQKGKKVSYKTVLNTCLSFLNEVKNLGKECEY